MLPFLALFMASVLPVSGFVQSLTPTNELSFEWSLSSDGNTMSMSLICDFDKWCAVAFGSSMSDADTITCSTTTPGSCEDAHSTGQFQPPRDAVQNLNSITSTTNNGKTTYTMTRLLNTGDSVDRVLVLGTTPIMWSIGPNLDISAKHTNKSNATILLTVTESTPADEEDEDEEEVRVVYLILALVLLLLPAIFAVLAKLCCRDAFEAPRFLGRLLVKGVGVYVVGVMWAAAAVCFFFADEDGKKSLGKVAQLLLGVTLSMPFGRQSWIWICFGMPHEKVVFFHGIIGFLFMAVGTLHGFAYIVDGEDAFEWGGDEVNNLAGTLAIVFLFALCATSLPPVRRGAYHIFLMAHWCFTPLVLVFSIIHVPSTIVFLIPGVISLIAQRIVRNFIVPYYTVVSKDDSPSQAYSKMVVAPAVPPTKESIFNFRDIFPGMYVRVRVKSNMLQSHPFSVMRVHPETCGFSLIVKNVGKGTSTDKMIQDLQTGSLLRVSEPCGAASMDLLNYERVLLVGGGVGVAPLVAALNYLRARSREPQELEGQAVQRRVTLVWAVRDVELLELLADELISCINTMSDLDLQIHYTGVVNGNKNEFGVLGSKIKYGRPAIDKVLEGLGDPKCFENLAVFTCGPHALTGAAKKAVSVYAGRYNWMKADVHNETFEM